MANLSTIRDQIIAVLDTIKSATVGEIKKNWNHDRGAEDLGALPCTTLFLMGDDKDDEYMSSGGSQEKVTYQWDLTLYIDGNDAEYAQDSLTYLVGKIGDAFRADPGLKAGEDSSIVIRGKLMHGRSDVRDGNLIYVFNLETDTLET